MHRPYKRESRPAKAALPKAQTERNGADTTAACLDLQELVALWWRLACQGMRLPAELGVILIEGGRP